MISVPVGAVAVLVGMKVPPVGARFPYVCVIILSVGIKVVPVGIRILYVGTLNHAIIRRAMRQKWRSGGEI